ncbi:unnamed protein product [Effrenium voratum]|uniref:Uncharacterized protein n=1 Tax=Effrenium voratum TaxID=2562239 RepID=A0AA36JMS5_9DINO|nr:unnamed protein product [Effrenium voratum]
MLRPRRNEHKHGAWAGQRLLPEKLQKHWSLATLRGQVAPSGYPKPSGAGGSDPGVLALKAEGYTGLASGRYARVKGWADIELLPALRQHLRRDMHPERLALLELLEHLRAEEGEDEERLLQRCEGRVQVYVSQYPCVSCLAVFCQFRRRCPNIQLEVAFDNAWTTFCGQPRNR